MRDLSSRQPVADVRVSLGTTTPGHARALASAISDAIGRFQLSISPGHYRLDVLGPVVLAEPFTLALPRGSTDRDIDVDVFQLARVEGRVVDGNGDPLADITVVTDAVPPRRAISDDRGRFAITVRPGQVELHAYSDTLPDASTTLRWVEPGAHLTGIEIAMETGVALAGVVVDGADAPVAGAEVRARADQQQRPRTATTGVDGRFEMHAIRAGRISVQAAASGMASSANTILHLEAGARADGLRLVLGPPVSIRGRVVDDAGRALAGVLVRAVPVLPDLHESQASGQTDDRGIFELSGLAAAPHLVTARAPDGVSAAANGVVAPATDVELVVPRGSALAGLVLADDGRPLADFQIRLERLTAGDRGPEGPAPGAETTRRRFLSEDGAYELTGLYPGTYRVTYAAPGKAPHTIERHLPAGEQTHYAATLRAGARLRGTVTQVDDDRPVRGASIQLSTGSASAPVYTDAQGAFVIEDIAAGRRSLVVSHPAYVGRMATGIDILQGGERTVDVQLERLAFGADQTVEFAGIGAALAMANGVLQVRSVIPHGPAEIAGLQEGDDITHIDGYSTGERTMGDNIESIRGVVGTVVRLTVARADDVFVRDVVRASIRFIPGALDNQAPGPEDPP